MLSLDTNTKWISSYEGKVLSQAVFDEQIKTIKEITFKIYDMARTQSNDILLSMNDSSEVKLLTNAGKIKSFISVSPQITTAIHVTNNNDIILGVMEEDTYKLTDKSCRNIIVLIKQSI